MKKILAELKAIHENSCDVWFFVNSSYRILGFNKLAYNNSKTLHGEELTVGASILDYARDTNNRIDEILIKLSRESLLRPDRKAGAIYRI